MSVPFKHSTEEGYYCMACDRFYSKEFIENKYGQGSKSGACARCKQPVRACTRNCVVMTHYQIQEIREEYKRPEPTKAKPIKRIKNA